MVEALVAVLELVVTQLRSMLKDGVSVVSDSGDVVKRYLV